MKHIRKSLPVAIISAVVGVIIGTFFTVSAQDQKVFELRTYQATPGNLDNLHARFRDHTIRIFRKHGMEIVGRVEHLTSSGRWLEQWQTW